MHSVFEDYRMSLNENTLREKAELNDEERAALQWYEVCHNATDAELKEIDKALGDAIIRCYSRHVEFCSARSIVTDNVIAMRRARRVGEKLDRIMGEIAERG